uniref:Actin-related protein 2/3 complex subunit n=1 Tax=Palpitomonas bilix TaxID=652834 RepID=A0A7S3GG97_9EUKA|mmetsp:Transcript_47843/g.124161  ORF Transcript_47843/g.124161 Transcript_47843/m.124161 type:complete len:394 (+) Transcript_47843:275-1456(+)|eukprot:CAMPEP_0113867348 /NCGR_PEP_ID=MMETSP0780_2-20120614/370_1 /TAXON_ID=652834 /ORGANISM="Palpitomonas bilix" /LENGTH=393 /DNA_ID=CAMNT_0000852283 /DNA_START=124 /DNA_END=1305 /DNA_ORIENTATION=- /assembly_acc=CAM_ASM_000599
MDGKRVVASADASVLKVADQCTCHAWNKDRSMLAYCPNNNELHILVKGSDGQWIDQYNLKEHDQVITSMDWAWETNRIVTCSMDRNAYVWKFEDDTWKPTLVILRQNRACTHVRWSPQENKFAVASGAKCVSVCYFEEENDWWVSKVIKEDKAKVPIFGSTVTSVAWHHGNILLATGSSDNKVRLISTAVKGVDSKRPKSMFGVDKPAFGKVVAEFESTGWVEGLAFSPSGATVAWTGQDSSIYSVDIGDMDAPIDQSAVQVLRLSCSPLRCILFLSESEIVCGGYDMTPMVFKREKGGWVRGKNLDESKSKGGEKKQSAVSSAFAKFENVSKLGVEQRDTALKTVHQNCISCIVLAGSTTGGVAECSTSGLDGRVCIWEQQCISEAFKNLSI